MGRITTVALMKLWVTLWWLNLRVFALTATKFDDPKYSNLVKLQLKLLPDELEPEVEEHDILSIRIGEITDTVYLYGQARINNTWNTVLHANTTLVLPVQPSVYGFEVDDRKKFTYFTTSHEADFLRVFQIDAEKQRVATVRELPQMKLAVNSKTMLLFETNLVFMVRFTEVGKEGVCMWDTTANTNQGSVSVNNFSIKCVKVEDALYLTSVVKIYPTLVVFNMARKLEDGSS